MLIRFCLILLLGLCFISSTSLARPSSSSLTFSGGWKPVAAPRPPAPRCARCGVRRRGRCARAAEPARQPGRAPPSPPALPGGGCGSGAGEPGELRVTGAPRAAAEDGHDRGRGRECGVKVPVSRSRLPRGARARCRVSARSGLSLPRFETFRRRPSARHAPATAALAVPGSGQALASRRADPFSGRGRSEAASAGERAGKGAGSPAQGANPGAAPRLRTRGSASAAGSPRRAAPGPAPRRAAGSPRRPGKRCGPTACTSVVSRRQLCALSGSVEERCVCSEAAERVRRTARVAGAWQHTASGRGTDAMGQAGAQG
ncbi:translation initiation factor IF-2-like [Falco cherrug]|uniref:translation initiation factor IF-2-like n=1 Tax=Falco cherrug TaxID=345164 RepID=UPI002479EC86|nr:translation initiation factor IF-2-like [Falco cherrug]